MAGVIQNLTMLLSGAGYRTGDANPGRVMPEISEPVIVLSLEQLDTEKRMAKVRVTIVSPLGLGARICEDEALKVCKLLRNAGAACQVQPYKIDTKTELVLLSVMATLHGNILSNNWQLGEGCGVRFDGDILDQVVSFTAWRQVNKDTDGIQNMLWNFRVEEEMEGIQEEREPVEPFVITVSHGDAQEVYNDCVLTSHKRVLTDSGVVQIREGIAKTRTVSA